MCDTTDIDTSLRNDCEISAATVKRFYGTRVRFFDEAIDAIVAGCVTEYSFDDEEKKFVGNVRSFDGNCLYDVKIFVTADFGIELASCECYEPVCCHTGALALHTGFKAPIFSELPAETEETNAKIKDSTTRNKDRADDVSNICDNKIEFVRTEVEKTEANTVEVNTSDSDADEDNIPIAQLFVKHNDRATHVLEMLKYANTSEDPVRVQPKARKSNDVIDVKATQRNETEIEESGRLRLTITTDEWENKMNYATLFAEKLKSELGDSCLLQSVKRYASRRFYNFKFKCMRNGCSRRYCFSIITEHFYSREKKFLEFDVAYTGEPKHRRFTKKEIRKALRNE